MRPRYRLPLLLLLVFAVCAQARAAPSIKENPVLASANKPLLGDVPPGNTGPVVAPGKAEEPVVAPGKAEEPVVAPVKAEPVVAPAKKEEDKPMHAAADEPAETTTPPPLDRLPDTTPPLRPTPAASVIDKILEVPDEEEDDA
jgi:hypothetical protein